MPKKNYEIGPTDDVLTPEDLPTVPTLVSSLQNDAGYVTRYTINTITPAISNGTATATLFDRASNSVSLDTNTVTTANFTFPTKENGKSRDFFLRLTLTGNGNPPTIHFYEPNGDPVTFDAEDDSWGDIELGVNILLFAETAQ